MKISFNIVQIIAYGPNLSTLYKSCKVVLLFQRSTNQPTLYKLFNIVKITHCSTFHLTYLKKVDGSQKLQQNIYMESVVTN